jgi:protein SCO1/2
MIRFRTALLATLFAASAACADDAASFAWRQHPGAAIPLSTVLHDQSGRDVTLAALLGSRPVVLDLGYFHCPSLCGVVRSDLFRAAAQAGLVPGRDFSLLSLSIDPAETPADAAAARAADLAQTPADPANIHYLTGDSTPVQSAVGFHARYDTRFKQFMHPAGLVVLTRSGVISTYLLGVGYGAGDLRAAVLRAGDGGIAQAALPILLLCFHFDSTTGRYTLAVEKVLRLAAGLTVLMLGGMLVLLHARRR